MHLEFGQVNQLTPVIPNLVQTSTVENQAVKISQDAEEKDKVDELREEIDELLLSDPSAHEKFIAGILRDADGGETI